ncbi:MAG: hypothetical protein JWO36_3930 [Myxococcales bacterium]|nr:hypothetical protein [Myxococcales bacterium]
MRIATVVFWVSLLVSANAVAAPRPNVPPEVLNLYKSYPVIELVTMGVGALAWERHGHIALCVREQDHAQDRCYNYGIGDFHHPIAMASGFFRGANSFWVGKMDPQEMLSIYRYADRTIWFQPLPLTAEQKQKVIDKLENDILEEHKYYAYDHFADNCTTRIRDILDNATGGQLSSMTEPTDGKTFRDLARDGFYGMRLFLLITDVQMGRSTDRVPTYWERMFLPEYLREAVAKRWGIQPIPVFTRTECEQIAPGDELAETGCKERGAPYVDGPSGRVLFALFILLATASAWATKLWGRFQRTGLAIAILPPILLGLVMWFLAILSPLPYVRGNETCLVFFPFDLLVLLPILSPARKRRYARGRVAMLALIAALHVVGLIKQPLFAPILWPLIPLLVVGFWRPEWSKAAVETKTPDAKPAKKPSMRKNRGGKRS